MTATEKQCTNPGCAFNGQKIKVEAKQCIGCKRDLKATGLGALSDLLDGFNKDVKDIFKDIK